MMSFLHHNAAVFRPLRKGTTVLPFSHHPFAVKQRRRGRRYVPRDCRPCWYYCDTKTETEIRASFEAYNKTGNVYTSHARVFMGIRLLSFPVRFLSDGRPFHSFLLSFVFDTIIHLPLLSAFSSDWAHFFLGHDTLAPAFAHLKYGYNLCI